MAGAKVASGTTKHKGDQMKRFLIALYALTLAGFTFAQADWHESGLLTAEIDGVHYELRSYYTQVADDVADNIEDEAVREFAQRYAGTVQHTATYRYVDAIEMAGMVMMPARIRVSIGLRTDADQSVPGQLDMEFALDPETLELIEGDLSVRYYVDDWDLSDYYGLTEGEVLIDEIVDNGDDTWHIRGRISGSLTHQTSLDPAHNPDDALSIEAEFIIDTLARR